jgi:poly(hydroxyalkanoate) granule-associated protein
MSKKLAGRGRRPVAEAHRTSVFPELGTPNLWSDSLQSGFKKLEDVFDERVASALHRLGIPSAKEVERLQRQMEELVAQVQSLRQARRRK